MSTPPDTDTGELVGACLLAAFSIVMVFAIVFISAP
jgi:hypothetical protein